MRRDKQQPYSQAAYERAIKPFHALIGSKEASAAKRVTVEARNLEEAERLLEAEYGSGMIRSLWFDPEWQLPR
jgi:hypothetical protein